MYIVVPEILNIFFSIKVIFYVLKKLILYNIKLKSLTVSVF